MFCLCLDTKNLGFHVFLILGFRYGKLGLFITTLFPFVIKDNTGTYLFKLLFEYDGFLNRRLFSRRPLSRRFLMIVPRCKVIFRALQNYIDLSVWVKYMGFPSHRGTIMWN